MGVILYKLFFDEKFLLYDLCISDANYKKEIIAKLLLQDRYKLQKNELITDVSDYCPTNNFIINATYVGLMSSMMEYNPLDRPALNDIKKIIKEMLEIYQIIQN